MKKDWSSDDFVHHWKHYLPPARASPSDLKFIKKKILEKGKGVKILVLGATPEYRNLCGELGAPVTLFDFSKRNVDYLAQEVKNRPQERFIEGNWIKDIVEEKFDIILADNVINVIKKSDVESLFKNVSGMLKIGGLFMPRTYVRDKGERYTPEEAIREYREERKGQKLYSATVRNLHMSVYDFKNDRHLFSDVWKAIKQLYEKGVITKHEFEEYRKLGHEGRNFQFYIPLREELDKKMEKFFKIKDRFYGSEKYLKDQFPLYVLTKK